MTEEVNLDLPFDGERYIPGMGGRIAAEHIARYAFATQFVRGKTVLDIASGEGYGTAIMAKEAKSIIGMDVAENAIAYAKRKYADVRNAQFEFGDLTALPFDAKTFDVIVCYETVEHVHDPIAAINELNRVLKDKGLLIISTPNKENYSDRFEYQNPFHMKELAFPEFQGALKNSFKHTRLFGQFSGGSSHIFGIDDQGQWQMPKSDFEMTYANVPKWTKKPDGVTATPLYFLAVCSKMAIAPEIQHFGFFDASDWQVIEDEFLLRKTQHDLEACDAALANTKQELENHKIELNSVRSSLQAVQDENQKLSSALDTKVAQINRLSEALDSSTEQLQNILSSRTWHVATRLTSIVNKNKALKGVAKFLVKAIIPRR